MYSLFFIKRILDHAFLCIFVCIRIGNPMNANCQSMVKIVIMIVASMGPWQSKVEDLDLGLRVHLYLLFFMFLQWVSELFGGLTEGNIQSLHSGRLHYIRILLLWKSLSVKVSPIGSDSLEGNGFVCLKSFVLGDFRCQSRISLRIHVYGCWSCHNTFNMGVVCDAIRTCGLVRGQTMVNSHNHWIVLFKIIEYQWHTRSVDWSKPFCDLNALASRW